MTIQNEAPPSNKRPSTIKTRDNNRVLTPEQAAMLDTRAIRGLYRYAEHQGAYFGGGYKPGEPMGQAVIGTVRGLCDALDQARSEIAMLHATLDQVRDRTKSALKDCRVRTADHNPEGEVLATDPNESLYQFWRGKESAYQSIEAIVDAPPTTPTTPTEEK